MTTLRDPAIQMLQRYHGNPLTVLVALVLFHERNGVQAIAALRWLGWATDLSPDTLTRVLYKLQMDGLVETLFVGGDKHARLTSAAAQLPLPSIPLSAVTSTLQEVNPLKAESLSSSSSSLNNELTDSSLQLLPLQEVTPLKAESLTVNPAPEVTRLADLLQDLGCPRALAHAAVADALTDDSPPLVEAQVILWQHYCASPAGRSIQAVGLFVARKIQNGERAPSSARQSLQQLPHPEATGQPWDPARDWPHPDYVRLLELTEASTGSATKGDPDAP